MGNINIELLRDASYELRQIKDGKGHLKISDRLEAANALKKIHSLVLKLDESKKQEERVAKEVRDMDPNEVSELKREMMQDVDTYFAGKSTAD